MGAAWLPPLSMNSHVGNPEMKNSDSARQLPESNREKENWRRPDEDRRRERDLDEARLEHRGRYRAAGSARGNAKTMSTTPTIGSWTAVIG